MNHEKGNAYSTELENNELVYKKMIEEIQDYAIILIDQNGFIQNWNIGAEKIKLYSEAEIIGKHFSTFYLQSDLDRGLPNKLLTEARETGRAGQEGWRKRKDGSRFWGSITITAIHNDRGDVIGFTKVTRDLTAQKITEDKLAAYTAELEKQNSELEQFAYVASHDLQEPLRKIQTFTEMIRENYADKAFIEKYFEKLNFSASRMSELIKSLLNYSRLSKQKESSVITEVDLNDILNEVKIDFELLIEEKKATVTSSTLPCIQGNRFQIGQLFSNLISNSLKFSKEKPIIKITASIVSEDQLPLVERTVFNEKYFQIIFEDNGIGFENEYKELIFSLFQRLHGKQSEYSGTGIGLALCKKIMDIHNGFMTANGTLGKGATFTVYFPC